MAIFALQALKKLKCITQRSPRQRRGGEGQNFPKLEETAPY